MIDIWKSFLLTLPSLSESTATKDLYLPTSSSLSVSRPLSLSLSLSPPALFLPLSLSRLSPVLPGCSAGLPECSDAGPAQSGDDDAADAQAEDDDAHAAAAAT